MSDYMIFANGATWIRADFHLHTLKAKEFTYDGDENNFISEYIAGLKKANIGLGIITNHNKFDRDEFKALRKNALKEEIYLLPGIELSVKDGKSGLHALVVFNDEWLCRHYFTNQSE